MHLIFLFCHLLGFVGLKDAASDFNGHPQIETFEKVQRGLEALCCHVLQNRLKARLGLVSYKRSTHTSCFDEGCHLFALRKTASEEAVSAATNSGTSATKS